MGLEASDLTSRYLFNTNYVVWDNIGLQKKDKTLATYQLMAEVFDKLDIHSGTVFNYHQTRRQTQNYLADLELLQYDMLYGKCFVYGGKKNAPTVDGTFQMGILDVTLSSVEQSGEESYIFYGENMTANSKVYVNGNKHKTTFYNDARIELKGMQLEEGDIIVVSQVGSSSRVFRTSVEYVYTQGQLVLASEYVPPVVNPEEGITDGETIEGITTDEAATEDIPEAQTQ